MPRKIKMIEFMNGFKITAIPFVSGTWVVVLLGYGSYDWAAAVTFIFALLVFTKQVDLWV